MIDEAFENDVNQYGTQTTGSYIRAYVQFENDVNQYGTQTNAPTGGAPSWFENDVNQYGTQTFNNETARWSSLRMM